MTKPKRISHSVTRRFPRGRPRAVSCFPILPVSTAPPFSHEVRRDVASPCLPAALRLRAALSSTALRRACGRNPRPIDRQGKRRKIPADAGCACRLRQTIGPASRLPLPIVRVTLSRPVYDIAIDPKTGAPQMPRDVTAIAQIAELACRHAPAQSFTWHVALDWDYKPFPTHHDISKATFVHASPFTVDFGKQIRGGKLTVTAKATVNGREISGQATAIVRGVNPSQYGHFEGVSAYPLRPDRVQSGDGGKQYVPVYPPWQKRSGRHAQHVAHQRSGHHAA